MVKLSFDAGHGKYTAGKRAPSGKMEEREWFFNDKILKYTLAYLKKYNVQTKRFDDPTGEQDIPLKERVKRINVWNPDLHLSFHNNAYLAKWGNHGGTETYTSIGSSKTSETIAKKLEPALVKSLKTKSRGHKKANFYIIRNVKAPASLIEFMFMDSNQDIKKLRKKKYLKKAGETVAKVLVKHYGLKKKKKTKNDLSKKPLNSNNSKKFKLTSSTGGYSTAADAKVGRNKKTTVKKGSYHIFNESGGMVNVTKKKGTPGSWINPNGDSTTTSKPKKKTYKVNQKVKIKKGAGKYSRVNVNIPSRYKNKKYTVQQVGNNDVLIKELYSWVKKSDLK